MPIGPSRVCTLYRSAAVYHPTLAAFTEPLTGTTTAAFSRPIAVYVIDFENVARHIKSDEIRYAGYRRVENLYTGSAALGTQGVTTLAASYTVSFTGTGTITFSGTFVGSLVGAGAGTRVMLNFTATAGTLTSTVTGTVTNAQLELVAGQAVTIASEYVDSATAYGANVTGVRYFGTLNGNTASGSPLVVTAGVGATIVAGQAGVNAVAPVNAGGPWAFFSEKTQTELLGATAAIRRTMTDVGWVATNITVAAAVGFDGVPASGARLTASAANGTILYTTALANSSYAYGAWVRRVSGTGSIQMTLNNGVVWNAFAITTDYQLFVYQTNTVPVVGFKIVTSGDVIEVDFNQIELTGGDHSVVPLPLGATNTVELLTVTSPAALKTTAGAIYIEMTPGHTVLSNQDVLFDTRTDGLNYLKLSHDFSNFNFTKTIANVAATASFTAGYTPGTTIKIAGSWGAAGVNIYVNGVKGTPNSSATAAAVGALIYVGTDSVTNGNIGAGYRNMQIFDGQPTDATLIALTT